jgi:predicted Zn finger-like uncharacterized protein
MFRLQSWLLASRREPQFQLEGTAASCPFFQRRSIPSKWRPLLNQLIHFNCEHCGTVYATVRTDSPTERVYRVYCPTCRHLLHDDTGFYCLSELAIVDRSQRSARYQQEAERCRRLAAESVDTVERDTLLRIADEWMKLASQR